MALTDLPNELLARIYHYLDWDPARDIQPNLRDIISVSLTCQKLRDAVLPVLFRSVRLALRWDQGSLVEPKLYWLRRNRPHLARHVRCVVIDTKFSKPPVSAAYEGHREAFTIPTDKNDWIDPDSVTDQYQAALFTEIRAQGDSVARKLHRTYLEEYGLPSPSHERPAEDIIREIIIEGADQEVYLSSPVNTSQPQISPTSIARNDSGRVDVPDERDRRRSIRFSLEALAVALLCIPPTIDTLIFRATPTHYRQWPREEFALRVAKAAILVFKSRIRDLTVIMKQRFRTPPTDRSCTPQALPIEQEEDEETNESINGLQSMERLVLTCCEEHEYPVRMSTLTRRNLFQWRQLATKVKHLDLRCARICYEDLLFFVEPFRALESLRLGHIFLDDHTMRLQQAHLGYPALIWLLAAIEIRQALQHTHIVLGVLHADRAPVLPDCCVTWIVQEAIPKGINIDMSRKERLIEDFKSFLLLWEAEQADRGAQAQVAWDQTGGMLVDRAMTSRWR